MDGHISGGLGVGSSNLPAPTNKIKQLAEIEFYETSCGVPVGFPCDMALAGPWGREGLYSGSSKRFAKPFSFIVKVFPGP
jgi:hypothetical protein